MQTNFSALSVSCRQIFIRYWIFYWQTVSHFSKNVYICIVLQKRHNI